MVIENTREFCGICREHLGDCVEMVPGYGKCHPACAERLRQEDGLVDDPDHTDIRRLGLPNKCFGQF